MKKCYIIIAFLFAGLFSFAETTLYGPELVSPADNATGQMPNALLNWDPVSGNIGLHYEIQLDTSNTFSNPIDLLTELSSVRPSGLNFATKYFWHVRAVDNTGNSDWSETRSFTVVVTVTLGNPADNALEVMPNAEIKWTAITGVSYFDLQLDTLATFDSPLSGTISVAGSLTKTNLSNLYFNTKYFRRMRVRHDNDTSIWSNSRSFTTLSKLILTKPNDNSIDQDPVTDLKWKGQINSIYVTGLTNYIVSIADNPDFVLPIIKQLSAASQLSEFSSSTDTLDFGKTYFWKVDGVHAMDIVSSPVRSFTTLNTVVLTAPANNQTGVELTPVFSWKPIRGCVRYDLWLCDTPAFDDGHLKQYKIANSNPISGMQEFQLPAYIIDSAGVYFWKVRALVPGDTSNWSDTYTFRVATTGTDAILPGKSVMSVYPNPAKDKIQVVIRSTERATLRLSISNLLGNTLIAGEVQFANGRSVTGIDVSSLPKGIYFVKIQKESSVFMSKLIIDR